MKKIILLLLLSFVSFTILASSNEPQLVGVNLSGAEYGSQLKDKAKQGTNYIWHNQEDIKRLAKAGFTVVRIPFLWERLQPSSTSVINNAEAIYLDRIIMAAEKWKIKVIIDPHNFGYYSGRLLSTDARSLNEFRSLWAQLANRYKRFPNVIFGLMNEPHKQSTTEWAKVAQAGVEGIREVGAKQLILVPGTKWSGAHNWTHSRSGPSNAEALLGIYDPLNKIAYEMHFYLDKNSSGTNKDCVSEDIGVQRLKSATDWLNKYHLNGFIGEFGVANNSVCLNALRKTLEYLKSNSNVWLGWTYWSASRWGGRYMFDIYSLDPDKQPQFNIIQSFLK